MNGMNGMNGMVTMVGLQGVHWPHDVAWAVWAHSLVIGLLGASIPLLLGGITLLPMVGYELLQRQWRRRQRRRQRQWRQQKIRCGAGVRSAPIVSSRTKKIIPVLVAAAREAESEAAADWSEVRYRWLEASSLQPMEMATLPRMPRYALN